MHAHISRLAMLAVAWTIFQAPVPAHGWPDILRRSLSQRDTASDWTREAWRNLSRWESQLLLNTLGKLRSSHVLGEVPFDLYGPVVTCPPPSKLMRLDPTGPTEHPTNLIDGAKWMCVPFPQTSRQGCVVLSFGSNDQFEFEQAALDLTPCTVHTFDCTKGMIGTATNFDSIDHSRHTFHPYCVGSRDMASKDPEKMLAWEGILEEVRPKGPDAVQQQHGRGAVERMLQSGSESEQGIGGGGVGHPVMSPLPPQLQRRARGVTISTAVAVAAAVADGAEAQDVEAAAAIEDASGQRRRLQRSGLWVGGGGGSAGRVHQQEAATAPEVFILKIDVEGFEWDLLSDWGPDTPGLPTFIAVEIHNWITKPYIKDSDLAAAAPPPPRPRYSNFAWWLYGKRITQRAARDAATVLRRQRVDGGELSLMFLHLARLGYAIASREINPCGGADGKPCCAEYLLIRVRGLKAGRPGGWDLGRWFSSLQEDWRHS